MPITAATSRSKCRLTTWQGTMGYIGTELSLTGTRCRVHSADHRQKPASAGPNRSLSRVGMEWRARLRSEWALVERPLGTVLAPVRRGKTGTTVKWPACLRESQVENCTRGPWRALRMFAWNLTQISRFRAKPTAPRSHSHLLGWG